MRIKAKVERAVVLEGKAAFWIVHLHGRDTEVCEDHVRAGDIFRGQDLGQAGKVGAADKEAFRRKTRSPKACLGFGKFERVNIESDKPAAGLDCAKQFESVSTVAKRSINGNVPRFRREDFQDFLEADRPVRARGSFAAGNNLVNFGNVAFRVMLFIFFGKAAG